jgi:hypothetical protein
MESDQVDSQNLIDRAAALALELHSLDILSRGDSIADETSAVQIDQDAVAHAYEIGKDAIQEPAARKAICAALRSTGDDLKDIAKTVAAALLPLSLAGVVALPVTPLALAAAAVLVYRLGVAAYCSNVNRIQED